MLLLWLLASLVAGVAADDPHCYWAGPRVDCGKRVWALHRSTRPVPPQRLCQTLTHSLLPRCCWAGYPGITQDACESKGCCWAPADFDGAPHADLPWCAALHGQ